jgi:hypothetical protein
MTDLIFVVLTLLFFASCFGLVAICRNLAEKPQ